LLIDGLNLPPFRGTLRPDIAQQHAPKMPKAASSRTILAVEAANFDG